MLTLDEWAKAWIKEKPCCWSLDWYHYQLYFEFGPTTKRSAEEWEDSLMEWLLD